MFDNNVYVSLSMRRGAPIRGAAVCHALPWVVMHGVCQTCRHSLEVHGLATVPVLGIETVTIACTDCPGGLCHSRPVEDSANPA